MNSSGVVPMSLVCSDENKRDGQSQSKVKKRKFPTDEAESNKRLKPLEQLPVNSRVPLEKPLYVHFIQFETRLLTEKRRNYSSYQNIGFLRRELHEKILEWPRVNRPSQCFMTTVNATTSETAQIEFKDVTSFLTINLDNYQGITSTQSNPQPDNWSQADIDDIISYFQQFFPAPNSKSKKKEDKQNGQQHDKKVFDELVEKHRHLGINQRMQALMQFCITRGEKHFFRTNWPGTDNPLEFLLTKDSYYSTSLTEASVLKEHYPGRSIPANQIAVKYYTMQVYECKKEPLVEKRQVGRDNKICILKLWFSFDALVGELVSLNKGFMLSGNQVLIIYEYLVSFLQIKTVYLYDDSQLKRTNEQINKKTEDEFIPLRTLTAISDGESWYTKQAQFKLFTCSSINSSLNGQWSQNEKEHKEAIAYLQKCSRKEVEEYTQKEDELIAKSQKSESKTSKTDTQDRKPRYPRLVRIWNAHPEAKTLQALVKVVKKDARENNNTRKLYDLSQILGYPQTTNTDYHQHLATVNHGRIFYKQY